VKAWVSLLTKAEVMVVLEVFGLEVSELVVLVGEEVGDVLGGVVEVTSFVVCGGVDVGVVVGVVGVGVVVGGGGGVVVPVVVGGGFVVVVPPVPTIVPCRLSKTPFTSPGSTAMATPRRTITASAKDRLCFVNIIVVLGSMRQMCVEGHGERKVSRRCWSWSMCARLKEE